MFLESYDNGDAGIFGIANEYSSEDDDTLADEQKEELTFSEVRTRQTEQNTVSSADGFMLDREAVVRFVQIFIAHAVERQKRTLTRMEE